MDFVLRSPPAVRAILWMDAVLLVGVALAFVGKSPAVGHGTDLWTWLALAGSVMTAALAALSAFHLCAPAQNPVWMALPVPAMVLWVAAIALGYLTLPADADPWGDVLAEAGECFAFLLKSGLPLLALIVFMLWRAAPVAPRRVLAMGALASAGGAASLLTLVHPHVSAFADLCAHGTAFAVMLGIGAAFARARRRSPRD
jgi:Negative regulator of sigma F